MLAEVQMKQKWGHSSRVTSLDQSSCSVNSELPGCCIDSDTDWKQ